MYWILARYGSIAFVGLIIGWVVNGWRLDASINAYKASIAASEARLIQEYRLKEQRLQEAANTLRKAKDDEIKTITNRLNSTIAELRQRQDRTMSDTARTCSGATGANLSRQDAEFLARLAAEADQAVVERNQCIQQYRNAR